MSEERMAPEGKIWVCCACGKTADDSYGIDGWHSWGWDESCMLNAVLMDRADAAKNPQIRMPPEPPK
jgi:hypothetical protein